MVESELRAAWGGDLNAQCFVAHAYDRGVGVPQDHAEALRWFRAAAKQGDAEAQNNLGVMYHNGDGLPGPDPPKALKWYRAAARQGEPAALHNLAGMHHNGEAGLKPDPVKAAELNRVAAVQYTEGEGGLEDDPDCIGSGWPPSRAGTMLGECWI